MTEVNCRFTSAATAFQVAEHIDVAEGFGTAWAAQLMHKLLVWAALGSKRYLKLKLPREVKRVTIFADPDSDGLLYAEKFRQANPALGVEIVTPGAGAGDFARVWQREGRAARFDEAGGVSSRSR
ncbi:MAG: toprim domain-containing protein [Methylocystis sp.]